MSQATTASGHVPITPAQIRAIHAACTRQGVDDDAYRHQIYLLFGDRAWDAKKQQYTCLHLSRAQATTLLKAINRGKRYPPRKPPSPRPARRRARAGATPNNVVELATASQHQLIADMAREITWRTPGGYARWRKTYLGDRPIRTKQDASRVIEGLKKVKQHRRMRMVDGNKR